MANFQRYATRVKAVTAGGGQEFVLPVDTLTATPEPYLAEGNTAQERFNGTRYYQQPTFGVRLELQYANEETEFRKTEYATLADLVDYYTSGHIDGYLDFYLKYNGDGTYDPEFVIPSMIVNMNEGDFSVAFERQVRSKQRSLEFLSESSQLTYPEVDFLFE